VDNSYRISFGVERLDFPEQSISLTPSSALDAVRKTAIEGIGARLLNEVSITLGNSPGREIRFTAQGEKLLTTQRMYVVGDRLYVIFAVSLTSESTEVAVARFLDSFQLK
jgi:hypothetical protein